MDSWSSATGGSEQIHGAAGRQVGSGGGRGIPHDSNELNIPQRACKCPSLKEKGEQWLDLPLVAGAISTASWGWGYFHVSIAVHYFIVRHGDLGSDQAQQSTNVGNLDLSCCCPESRRGKNQKRTSVGWFWRS